MTLNLNELFPRLDKAINDPHEYTHRLTAFLAEIAQLSQTTSFTYVDGVPYTFDPVREKYLSLSRAIFDSSFYGNNIINTYLRSGLVPTAGEQGFLLPRDATITALWGKSRSHGNWNLEIRKNGVPITVASVLISNAFGYDSNTDIDLNAGDWVQFYLNGTSVQHPIVACEIAWRINP